MNTKNTLYKKGFTLIELIVSIGILTIILASIYSFFSFGNNTFSSGDSRYDIQTNLRSAVNYMTEQLRYSTDLEIISTGPVPSQATIPQYINYLYYDSTANSITHINKYYVKSIPIVNTSGTNTGSITFNSDSPYKTINFNIYAKKKSQEYNIEGDLNPLNINLGSGMVVGAAASPSTQTGAILKFKTASNYISQILMPVAKIGSTNQTKKFTVDFDRAILSVEIIASDTTGVTSPAATSSGKTVTVTTGSTSNGAKIRVRVTFNDYVVNGVTYQYGNIYEYSAVYDDTTKWDITPL